jgi:hypothetical protein
MSAGNAALWSDVAVTEAPLPAAAAGAIVKRGGQGAGAGGGSAAGSHCTLEQEPGSQAPEGSAGWRAPAGRALFCGSGSAHAHPVCGHAQKRLAQEVEEGGWQVEHRLREKRQQVGEEETLNADMAGMLAALLGKLQLGAALSLKLSSGGLCDPSSPCRQYCVRATQVTRGFESRLLFGARPGC